MPIHPNVRRCTHIQITGHRCGSPALKQEYFCYFHTRMIKGVQTRVDSEIHPIALIENPEAIQAALMHMIDAVLKGTLDNKRANIVLKALYIAVRNSRNVYFHLRQDDMVRQVPNFAQQYLSEHPELNPPEPISANPPEPSEPGEATAESSHCSDRSLATAVKADSTVANHKPAAKRRQIAAHDASRGNRAEIHPAPEERQKSFDPPPQVHAQPGSVAETDSLPSPKEKDRLDTTPPLTTRQSQRCDQIKKLEASIENAMRGNWRDLRTVFNAVGLTLPKPPASQKTPSNNHPAASAPARAPAKR